MSALKVFLLAIVQGVTEFLPISSSGHLVITGHLLGLDSPGVFLEVALHTGTLLSIIIFYRKKIVDLTQGVLRGNAEDLRYVGAVAASILPTALVYLLLGPYIESTFDNVSAVGICLCVTGVILLTVVRARRGGAVTGYGSGLLIGLAQSIALMPGISRSGTTIVAGRFLGLSPRAAAEFSLIMSLPVQLAAILLECRHFSEVTAGDIRPMDILVGIVAAALVGYVAILVLVKMLTAGKFWVFGFYCLGMGAAVLWCVR